MESNLKENLRERVFVARGDSLALVASKLFAVNSDLVIVAVPKDAVFLGDDMEKSLAFLRTGMDSLGKEFVIETIDDEIIDTCEFLDIKAFNPLLTEEGDYLKDGVDSDEDEDEELSEDDEFSNEDVELVVTSYGDDNKVNKQEIQSKNPKKKEEPWQEKVISKMENSLIKKNKKIDKEVRDVFFDAERELQEKYSSPNLKRKSVSLVAFSNLPFFLVFKVVVIAFVVFSGSFYALKPYASANISLITEKTTYEKNIPTILSLKVANTSVDSISNSATLPLQVFKTKKNGVLYFDATMKKKVEEKAKGKIYIYNAYGSEPQFLVENTRFEYDGKIFRLAKSVNVPGAKIENGKIIPSSVEAELVADAYGEDYNIGPVEKMTIPGFKRVPEKYNAFYGELRESLKGGISREVTYPSNEELENAKNELKKEFLTSALDDFKNKLPDGYEYLKNDYTVDLLKTDIVMDDKVPDDKFGLYAEVEYQFFGFKKDDLDSIFKSILKKDKGDTYDFESYDFSYNVKNIDKLNYLIDVDFDLNSTIYQPIDKISLEKSILDKGEDDIRALIFDLPGVSQAKVELWPFWENKSPSDDKRVRINID